MAVVAQYAGTITPVVGTETDITTVNIAGTFTLHVSKRNMVAGDTLELRIYAKLLTAETAEVVYQDSWEGVQPADDMQVVGGPISTELAGEATNGAYSLRFTLTQRGANAAKAYPSKVLRY